MKKLIQVGLVVCLFVSAMAGSVMAPTPALAQEPEQKTVTIIDDRGQQVEIPQPLERVCVFSRWNVEFVRAVGGWESVVCMDADSAKDGSYWPGFDQNNAAGTSQSPDYEKIVALKPQVVIMITSDPWAEAEAKLAPFGIKVVALNGWEMRGFAVRVATFGLMFDTRDRAQEFIGFYQKYIDLVQERVKSVENKKRVYYETAPDYKTCLSGERSVYHHMIEQAGGINVFGNVSVAEQPQASPGGLFEIDPEAVLVKNPDVVIKMGGGGNDYRPGVDEMKATWEKLVNRPGWDQLDAVKNEQVYVLSYITTNWAAKMVGLCYLAKWLYPELFPDLDPDAVVKEYLEKYQGLTYSAAHHYP